MSAVLLCVIISIPIFISAQLLRFNDSAISQKYYFSCIVPKVQQQQRENKYRTANTVDRRLKFVPTLWTVPLWQPSVCSVIATIIALQRRPHCRVQHNTPYKLKLTSIALLQAPLLARPQLQQQRATHSNTIKHNLQVACWFTRIKLKSTLGHETICIAALQKPACVRIMLGWKMGIQIGGREN